MTRTPAARAARASRPVLPTAAAAATASSGSTEASPTTDRWHSDVINAVCAGATTSARSVTVTGPAPSDSCAHPAVEDEGGAVAIAGVVAGEECDGGGDL